jgi:DNA-directed RNA polymerase II subunit RPB2
LGVIETIDLKPTELAYQTKVFVNGAFIGVHLHPREFVYITRLWRRNGLINTLTSISWDRESNEITFYTDQGRLCRPLYILDQVNNDVQVTNKIIKDLRDKTLTWQTLISGFNKRKVEFNPYDSSIYQNPDDVLILDTNKVPIVPHEEHIHLAKLFTYSAETIASLDKHRGIIEYIDIEELNTLMLATPQLREAYPNKRFTHQELHPSMMLGATMFLQPNITHNAAPRNIFSAAHAKQSVGVYTLNYRNRFDTSGSVLHYTQRPLTITRLNEVIHNEL